MNAARYPVSLELPVQWGEMDAFGHVNNAVYLRWFETARIAYFERVSVPRTLADAGPRPILGRATVDFRSPVTFPDTVTVEANVTRLGTTSFTMGYRASSAKQGRVVAEGEAVVVMIDPSTGLKTPLSPELRAAIEALQA
jgi:acyl-CoA thioester hydrolase